MPEPFTQLFTHLVFAVKKNKAKILQAHEADIHRVLGEVVQQQGHQLLIVDGTTDHVHLLIKMNPARSLSSLVREVKKQSSFYINHQLLKKAAFHWQEGYAAFSHTRSQVNALYKYIEKQKVLHADNNFHEEYLTLGEMFSEENQGETIFKHKYQ
ncbi:MAG: IS200/IS605 family transposase [Prolixibacteraceae bacterium]|nr:IS200/IS605 family transposase [Prolixibacteraceae bacterium]